MVLYVLSQIWRFGGEIVLQSDGSLKLLNHEKVHPTVLKSAEPIFDEISEYVKSVEGMNAVDKTVWKISCVLNCWMHNDKIRDFLNDDEAALNKVIEYQSKLAANGWTDAYDDWRKYENDQTELLKEEIYDSAIAYNKSRKVK